MVDTKTRRALIHERVVEQGEISFAELSQEFFVSEMTVRRDIEELEKAGHVRRIMGGAIATGGKATELPFATRATLAAPTKNHLGDKAASLIEPRQTVILDSGSTVLAVAKALKGKNMGLTIVTPSILVAVELHEEPDTTVILTGGTVRPGELSLIGPEAERSMSNFNCDVYVMGIAALDAEHGATDYHLEEAAVKRRAAKSADRIIVVADRRKLGRTQLMNVVGLEQIDTLITDASEADPVVSKARQLGVNVLCVADGEE